MQWLCEPTCWGSSRAVGGRSGAPRQGHGARSEPASERAAGAAGASVAAALYTRLCSQESW